MTRVTAPRLGDGAARAVTAPPANDTDVLTVVRFRARSRSTGRVAAMDLHHYFKFRDGKIAYYRGTEDTAVDTCIGGRVG